MDRFRLLSENRSLRDQIVERGRKRAELFSWKTSAELYLAAMAASDLASAPAGAGHRVPMRELAQALRGVDREPVARHGQRRMDAAE